MRHMSPLTSIALIFVTTLHPGASVALSLPPSISKNFTANESIPPGVGEFWAGATIGWVPREEAIPGRVFYDYDGKTVKDPIKTYGDAGVNAFRVETYRGQCLGQADFANNGSTLADELTFTLDIGCIGDAVKITQRAQAAGMKRFQLTINQGFPVPPELQYYTYPQMIENIKEVAKYQLQPFLDVGIVPDVILFENEGTDGFLMVEESTGHIRGLNDGNATTAKVNKELCGGIPTGNMASYPQYAGYIKAEINACNEAIIAAGFPIDTMRYGLHSHTQYVQWKEELVHGPDQHSQSDLLDLNGAACTNENPIPADLLAVNITNMLNIMGFSSYPEPMEVQETPSNANILATLTQLQGYSDTWGKYSEGPLAGQYKLPMLGVEYSTRYSYEQNAQQLDFTEATFSIVKKFPAFMGLFWYEGWYCYSDWMGGDAGLCHRITDDPEITGEAPTDTLKAWGAQAVSPWKSIAKGTTETS